MPRYTYSELGMTPEQAKNAFSGLTRDQIISKAESIKKQYQASTAPASSSAEIKQEELAQSGLRSLSNIEKMATLGNRIQAEIPGQIGAGEYVANKNEIIDIMARLRSGAALTKEEQDFYTKQLPAVFDSGNTIKAKTGILRNFLEGMAKKKEESSKINNTENPQNIEDPNATHGILDAFVKGFKNVGENINKGAEELNNTLDTPTTSPIGTFAKVVKTGTGLAKTIASSVIAEPIATGLRVAGEGVQDLTGVDVNEATSKGINALVKAGMDTNVAKQTVAQYEQFKKDNPESALATGAIGDIAELLSYVVGLKGAKIGATSLENTGRVGIKTAGELASKTAETVSPLTKRVGEITSNITKPAAGILGKADVNPEDAIKSFKENLLGQIEGKSSSLKKLDKTNTDIIDTIARNPDFHPEIDINNKTFDVTNSSRNLASTRQSYSDKLGELFSAVDEASGGYSTESLFKNIADNVLNPKNKAKIALTGGVEGSFMQGLKNQLDVFRSTFGDFAPRNEIWKFRQGIDQVINSMSDTQIAKSLRQDVRRGFASSLEQSLPNDTKNIVKRTMGEMQKIIEAENYTNDVLKGFKIQGGKLTDTIRNSVSANIGATAGSLGGAGGFALGGIPGAIAGAGAGFMASEKIGQWIARNTLLNASEKKAILSIVKKNPEVFSDIQEYMGGLKTKTASKEALSGMLKKLKK